MIGCLRTRVRKQPIIVLYFESELVLKFYNLEAWAHLYDHFKGDLRCLPPTEDALMQHVLGHHQQVCSSIPAKYYRPYRIWPTFYKQQSHPYNDAKINKVSKSAKIRNRYN